MTHNHYPPTRKQPVAGQAVLRLGRVLGGLLAMGLLAVLVAGVPYGLCHWIGWPLPHHVPTSTQVRDTLTGPFTDQILLDTLACLCWILWAVFLTDLAHALPATLHNTRHPHAAATADRRSGPLRGLAALLLTAILAGLLSLRPHPASASRSTAPLAAPRSGVVATALRVDRVAVPMAAAPIPSRARTAVVQAPHDGIHDSLWRIAQRHLGDGARWPEIYQLNKGQPQPDGGTLTMPSLIQPGWILQLPKTATTQPPVPAAGGQTRPGTSSPRPTSPHSSTGTLRPTPAPSITSAPSTPSPTPQPPTSLARRDPGGDRSSHSGVDLGDGVYVSLGLAAAISTSLVMARRRRRRFYVPGSGRRDDLPVAPVVRSLRLAHLRATTPPGDDEDSPTADGEEESVTDTGEHDPAAHRPTRACL